MVLRAFTLLIALAGLAQAAPRDPGALSKARAEFRAVVRADPGLRKAHRNAIVRNVAGGVTLTALAGAIPLSPLVGPGSMKAVATAAILTSAVVGTGTALFGIKEALPYVRAQTTRLAVHRGLVDPGTAGRWQRAGLITREWKTRYAADGLPMN